MIRSVANIVPPCDTDAISDGTSAALEFGICHLKVKHLIILGHSRCGGIQALLNGETLPPNSFINRWVSIIGISPTTQDSNECAKQALAHSYKNCLTYPWIKERMEQKKLAIHRWFFAIKTGEISVYSVAKDKYQPLTDMLI